MVVSSLLRLIEEDSARFRLGENAHVHSLSLRSETHEIVLRRPHVPPPLPPPLTLPLLSSVLLPSLPSLPFALPLHVVSHIPDDPDPQFLCTDRSLYLVLPGGDLCDMQLSLPEHMDIACAASLRLTEELLLVGVAVIESSVHLPSVPSTPSTTSSRGPSKMNMSTPDPTSSSSGLYEPSVNRPTPPSNRSHQDVRDTTMKEESSFEGDLQREPFVSSFPTSTLSMSASEVGFAGLSGPNVSNASVVPSLSSSAASPYPGMYSSLPTEESVLKFERPPRSFLYVFSTLSSDPTRLTGQCVVVELGFTPSDMFTARLQSNASLNSSNSSVNVNVSNFFAESGFRSLTNQGFFLFGDDCRLHSFGLDTRTMRFFEIDSSSAFPWLTHTPTTVVAFDSINIQLEKRCGEGCSTESACLVALGCQNGYVRVTLYSEDSPMDWNVDWFIWNGPISSLRFFALDPIPESCGFTTFGSVALFVGNALGEWKMIDISLYDLGDSEDSPQIPSHSESSEPQQKTYSNSSDFGKFGWDDRMLTEYSYGEDPEFFLRRIPLCGAILCSSRHFEPPPGSRFPRRSLSSDPDISGDSDSEVNTGNLFSSTSGYHLEEALPRGYSSVDCLLASASVFQMIGGNILVIGMYSGRLSVFRKPLEKELWNFECETYLPYPVYTILPLRRKSAFDFGFRSEDVELVDRSLEIRTCLISTRLLVGTLKGVHVFLLTVDEKSSLLQESSSPISS